MQTDSEADRPTILVIDDDPSELGMMSTVLSSEGYRVLIAEDGEVGIKRAIFATPDLILLDVMMPGIDGFETCRQLRRHKRTHNIPVFLKTCLRDEQSILKGMRVGIDDYVEKPCNHDRLLSMIKSRLFSVRRHVTSLHQLL